MTGFLEIATTSSVAAAQAANGSAEAIGRLLGVEPFEGLTLAEAQYIAERDSFYMASVGETGWPYVQHRGGPAGFLHVLDARTLAFADFRGNRQYISLGNVSANDRVALILVDYADKRRLKLYARIAEFDPQRLPALAEHLAGYRARIERAFLLRVEGYQWNCPQHLPTPKA